MQAVAQAVFERKQTDLVHLIAPVVGNSLRIKSNFEITYVSAIVAREQLLGGER